MENKENKQAAMPSGMNSMYRQTREEGEETIDLMEIFYLMWENLWKILACMLVGAVIAFAVTYFGMVPCIRLRQAVSGIQGGQQRSHQLFRPANGFPISG